jgi:hypothetical protein
MTPNVTFIEPATKPHDTLMKVVEKEKLHTVTQGNKKIPHDWSPPIKFYTTYYTIFYIRIQIYLGMATSHLL